MHQTPSKNHGGCSGISHMWDHLGGVLHSGCGVCMYHVRLLKDRSAIQLPSIAMTSGPPVFSKEFVRSLPDIWYKDAEGKETKEPGFP